MRLIKGFPKGFHGFTLIELSIVMIIIGLITGAIFKAQDLLESARIRATLDEVSRIRIALQSYRDAYGFWPGNDPEAADRLGGNAANGSGSGLIQPNEKSQVWIHLAKAGYLSTEAPPSAKIGGTFSAQGSPLAGLTGNWIILSNPEGNQFKPALTPQQALALKQKSGDSVRILDGDGAQAGACIQNGQINLENKSICCIAASQF